MITINLDGLADIGTQLNQIVSPAVLQRTLKKIAMKARQNSIDRATAQQDIDGSPFAQRKRERIVRGRNLTQKMQTQLAKRLSVFDLTEDGAVVGWRNPIEQRIALMNHAGETKSYSKMRFTVSASSDSDNGATSVMATRRQAKALVDLRFKVRRPNGRGFYTPTIKWITQNVNIAQAGAELRYLRGGAKSSWQTTLPPRAFLGVTEADLSALSALAKAEIQAVLDKQVAS